MQAQNVDLEIKDVGTGVAYKLLVGINDLLSTSGDTTNSILALISQSIESDLRYDIRVWLREDVTETETLFGCEIYENGIRVTACPYVGIVIGALRLTLHAEANGWRPRLFALVNAPLHPGPINGGDIQNITNALIRTDELIDRARGTPLPRRKLFFSLASACNTQSKL
jgi:hypothetical protein